MNSKEHTFVLIFDDNFIVVIEFSPEDPLHHEDEFVVRDVFIVNRDAADVIPKLDFDDQLPTQV